MILTALLLIVHVLVCIMLILVVLTGRPSWWRALAGGVLIGLAVVTKANAILLVPAMAAALLLDDREPSPRKRWAGVASMVLGVALALGPITAANHRLTGSMILVTTTGGSNLLKGNGPTATGSHAFLPHGATTTPATQAGQAHDLPGTERVSWQRRGATQMSSCGRSRTSSRVVNNAMSATDNECSITPFKGTYS